MFITPKIMCCRQLSMTLPFGFCLFQSSWLYSRKKYWMLNEDYSQGYLKNREVIHGSATGNGEILPIECPITSPKILFGLI